MCLQHLDLPVREAAAFELWRPCAGPVVAPAARRAPPAHAPPARPAAGRPASAPSDTRRSGARRPAGRCPAAARATPARRCVWATSNGSGSFPQQDRGRARTGGPPARRRLRAAASRRARGRGPPAPPPFAVSAAIRDRALAQARGLGRGAADGEERRRPAEWRDRVVPLLGALPATRAAPDNVRRPPRHFPRAAPPGRSPTSSQDLHRGQLDQVRERRRLEQERSGAGAVPPERVDRSEHACRSRASGSGPSSDARTSRQTRTVRVPLADLPQHDGHAGQRRPGPGRSSTARAAEVSRRRGTSPVPGHTALRAPGCQPRRWYTSAAGPIRLCSSASGQAVSDQGQPGLVLPGPGADVAFEARWRGP